MGASPRTFERGRLASVKAKIGDEWFMIFAVRVGGIWSGYRESARRRGMRPEGTRHTDSGLGVESCRRLNMNLWSSANVPRNTPTCRINDIRAAGRSELDPNIGYRRSVAEDCALQGRVAAAHFCAQLSFERLPDVAGRFAPSSGRRHLWRNTARITRSAELPAAKSVSVRTGALQRDDSSVDVAMLVTAL